MVESVKSSIHSMLLLLLSPKHAKGPLMPSKTNYERFDEDHVFSGMTPRKAHGMISKILRNSNGDERFKLVRRNEIAEFLEDRALNESCSDTTRLQCAALVLKIEAINLEFMKLQSQIELALAKTETVEQQDQHVILILPPNGSEVTDDADDQ